MEENAIGDFFSGFAKRMKEFDEQNTLEMDFKYPITIKGIKKSPFRDMSIGAKKGDFVAVRPCGNEKTYLGLYLGDMPLEILCHLENETQILNITQHGNPAIFVFDLSDIVWGCGSWWGKIKDEKHLMEITDGDIQNIWYVKALKKLTG